MIPLQKSVVTRRYGDRHVDLNSLGLPDTVESSDALLQQIGAVGQVKHHHIMQELKVATLTSNLGANQ